MDDKLHPLTAPVGALGNIQLGYGLLALSLLCAASVCWTRLVGGFFAVVVFGFVLLLMPWAPVRTVWELMPDKLIDATNIWPMQRFIRSSRRRFQSGPHCPSEREPDERPIKTRSLMPLKISVDAPRSSFVETPRVFIPGYQATVNGSAAEVVKSPEGLVAVPVPNGPSDVELNYEGARGLRVSFWFSILGFVTLPINGTWLWLKNEAR